MLSHTIVAIAALLVGWFILPAPLWVTNLWRKMIGKDELVPTPAPVPEIYGETWGAMADTSKKVVKKAAKKLK